MRTLFLVLLLSFSANISFAQQDSLFVSFRNDEWVLQHKVKTGETLFLLARRYHVPPAILADMNGLSYQDGLETGNTLYVPLGAFNLAGLRTINENDTRSLYYKVGATDNLFRISRYALVPQRMLQQWNSLADNTITENQTLYVGKLMYDDSQLPFKDSSTTVVNIPTPPSNQSRPQRGYTTSDSVVVIKFPAREDTIPEVVRDYMLQTNGEQNVVEEKGAVTFFGAQGKVKGSKTFFAFHNTTAKGTIIKVHNPGTGATVYAKVLGPMPGTEQYHNSIMGLSGAAKAALGVSNNRVWCELTYAGY